MRCAVELGAMIGTRDQKTIQSFANFGQAIGIAFQIRDDILGIWATASESGKTQAGDIYRRKKSLPILYTFEHANVQDLQTLHKIYSSDAPVTNEQVDTVLAIFEHTKTQAHCSTYLQQQCGVAYEALDNIPHAINTVSNQAIDDMKSMIQFIETAAYAKSS
jgi:geranylgeranyl diphosphate synthase type I